MSKFVRTFGVSAISTLIIWAGVALGLGFSGLFAVIVLTVLEITFSFDNAVVNAKLLSKLSPWWQSVFMTVGIFIAVFVVRFFLPVLIVSITSGLGIGDVVNLAFQNPELYGQKLAKAGPSIDAFGGMFLLMIFAEFFMDELKDIHWIKWLEQRLTVLGRYDNVGIFILVLLTVFVGSTINGTADERIMVIAAGICGVALHIGLDIFGAIVEEGQDEADPDVSAPSARHRAQTVGLVGAAAFVMFLRLEVLDASFSFDGVIGAFAIASSVVLIMAGLGAGALWVRSLTVHFVRAGTLDKYVYLEHGAHWAIGALGLVMIGKLYGIDPPEWITGSLGLIFIALAVWSSIRFRRKTSPAPMIEEELEAEPATLPLS
jgi:uncharacterized protein